jgi:hypothetical protein
MKKNKTKQKQTYKELVHQVKEYGLIARVDKVVELLCDKNIEHCAIAVTEDCKATVVVICKEDYYDEI